jgi:hypothetical protein
MIIHASSYFTNPLRNQALHSLSSEFGLGPVARICVKVCVEVMLRSNWGVPPHISLVSHPSRAQLANLHRPDASVPEALAFGSGASPISLTIAHTPRSLELSLPHIIYLSCRYTQCVSLHILQCIHDTLHLPPAISADANMLFLNLMLTLVHGGLPKKAGSSSKAAFIIDVLLMPMSPCSAVLTPSMDWKQTEL